jgi:hypothetical protein
MAEIYACVPTLRPVSYTPPIKAQEPEPSQPIEAATEPPTEPPAVGNHIVAPDVAVEADPAPEIPAPSPCISEADYESVGLMRMNGGWTHPEGDHVMHQILSGRIPLDEARRLARKRNERLARETFGLAARSSLCPLQTR